jgi:hypothetical protein
MIYSLLLPGWVVMALPSLFLIAGRHQRVSIPLYGLGLMILVVGAVHDVGFKRFLSGSAIDWIAAKPLRDNQQTQPTFLHGE